jgi:broad specificity phosphatase PhoE
MMFLVCHAEPVDTATWRDADGQRPLSLRGWQQAAGVRRRLSGFDLTVVLSSADLSCVQTVDELADTRRLPLRLDPRLHHGSRPADALELAVHDGAVLCTHADVIAGMLDVLRAQGADIPRAADCAPGSVWLIDLLSGPVPEAVYLPPLPAAPARVPG